MLENFDPTIFENAQKLVDDGRSIRRRELDVRKPARLSCAGCRSARRTETTVSYRALPAKEVSLTSGAAAFFFTMPALLILYELVWP